MTKHEKQLLVEELTLAQYAYNHLVYSYNKCQKLTEKDKFDVDELEAMEALTSRFARLCDILIQKIFRLIEKIDQDTPGTVRDRINMASKKGLISEADNVIEARTLRNAIAHEYTSIPVEKIFLKVMKLVPSILDAMENTKKYVLNKYQISLE